MNNVQSSLSIPMFTYRVPSRARDILILELEKDFLRNSSTLRVVFLRSPDKGDI
jgi:hypothetical protein